MRLVSSLEYAQFWVFGGTCVSLVTFCSHSVSSCIALCVVVALNSQAIQREACISTAKYEPLPFFRKPCWNYFQIIFTEKIKQKRTDEENAKAVKEQVFLWGYKSEPSIVDSSVFKSSAYCQYCHYSYTWSVAEDWNFIFKNMTVFFKVYSYLCLSVNGSGQICGC